MTEQNDKPETQEPSGEGEDQASSNPPEDNADNRDKQSLFDDGADEASQDAKVKMADKVESGAAPYDYSGELDDDPSNDSDTPPPAGYSLPNLMALLAIAVTVGVIYQGLMMFQDISHKVDDLNSSVALVAKGLMDSRKNSESTATVITRAELKKSLAALDTARRLGNPLIAGKAEKLQNDIRDILAGMRRPPASKTVPADSISEDIKTIIKAPALAIEKPAEDAAPAVIPDEAVKVTPPAEPSQAPATETEPAKPTEKPAEPTATPAETKNTLPDTVKNDDASPADVPVSTAPDTAQAGDSEPAVDENNGAVAGTGSPPDETNAVSPAQAQEAEPDTSAPADPADPDTAN